MKCYKCGAVLSEKDYCTSCGAEVGPYKKIISLSNIYYNDGLKKAKVRNLSGALVSLKRALKFYKGNYMARNLLGLIYFEIGEPVAALEQWIISTNMTPKKNIAEDYIKLLSANQGKLDAINQTIRKYNLCLDYCRQNSCDLAVIQLKKLLSVNTHFVQGHQLLALLYIREEEYEKAYKQLQKAIQIDSANTTTLDYLQEVQEKTGKSVHRSALRSDDGVKLLKKSKDIVEYQSGNEMIIQPTNIKENNGLWTIINIVIGLVIGAAVTGFLIVPARIQMVKNQYSAKENESYEQIQSKNAEIEALNAQIQQMQSSVDSANAQISSLQGDGGVIKNMNNLIEAERLYITGDLPGALRALATVNKETLEEQAKTAYQTVYDNCLPAILSEAEKQYRNRNNCDAAIQYYQQILAVDGRNEEALYHIAAAYAKKGQNAEAIQSYNNYLQAFPSGKYAANATRELQKLQGQQGR